MTTSLPARRGQVQPAFAIALGVVAVVGLAAAIVVSRPSAPAGPGPSDRPSTAPSAAPSPTPSADPTSKPSVEPSDGPINVVLRNATGHDVTALVNDETDGLVAAVSGNPGDGMSVRWHRAIVDQGDVNTIFVTWAGLPKDDLVNVNVAVRDGAYHLTLVQAGPVPYSDAMGEDRVVVLTFDHPVAADDVTVEILDRTVD